MPLFAVTVKRMRTRHLVGARRGSFLAARVLGDQS